MCWYESFESECEHKNVDVYRYYRTNKSGLDRIVGNGMHEFKKSPTLKISQNHHLFIGTLTKRSANALFARWHLTFHQPKLSLQSAEVSNYSSKPSIHSKRLHRKRQPMQSKIVGQCNNYFMHIFSNNREKLVENRCFELLVQKILIFIRTRTLRALTFLSFNEQCERLQFTQSTPETITSDNNLGLYCVQKIRTSCSSSATTVLIIHKIQKCLWNDRR